VAEIRRDLSAQEADTGSLADAVRPEKADDLSLLRNRETEKTERVLSILVHEIFLQGFWKTDNTNRVERTFADADSARDARLLADRGLRGLGINPNDFRAGPLRGAEGDAFEMAALGLTPILEDDGDAHYEFDEP